MTPAAREHFDTLLREALDELPESLAALLEEVPLIVDDCPAASLVETLARESGEEATRAFAESLCGLHTGLPMTERSVESPVSVPDHIQVFRSGVVQCAGGWDQPNADDAVFEEIWITLLHEMGHHFGLEEDDLEALGYA